jgi:hypothetical protein
MQITKITIAEAAIQKHGRWTEIVRGLEPGDALKLEGVENVVSAQQALHSAAGRMGKKGVKVRRKDNVLYVVYEVPETKKATARK